VIEDFAKYSLINLQPILPPGCECHGCFYENAKVYRDYLSPDICEVRLPNGLHVDVGYEDEESSPGKPFRVVVWRSYYGDDLYWIHLATIPEVLVKVKELAWLFYEVEVENDDEDDSMPVD
jgi:hypothetical protein